MANRLTSKTVAVPSEFTLETAIIFSSLSDPVFRTCLAQLRAPSRVRLVGGAGCGARVPVLTQTGAGSSRTTARAHRRRWELPFKGWTGRAEGRRKMPPG